MSFLRKKKIDLIASDIPPIDIFGENCGDLLVIGWGSTEGTIREAVIECRQRGLKVSSCHLYHLNPLPPDLEGIIKRFKKILIPEQNLGQLCTIIRSKFLVDAKGLNRVTGEPFKIWEIVEGIVDLCSQ